MILAADLWGKWTNKFDLALVLPQQERQAGAGQLCRGFRRKLLAESEAQNGKPNGHKPKSEQENNCNPETVPLPLCPAALINALKSTPSVAMSVQISTNGTENLQQTGRQWLPFSSAARETLQNVKTKEQQKHRAFLCTSLHPVLPFKASAS